MKCKAVSPIIATIILVLITVAVSTAAYYWMMGIQQSLQQDTSTKVDNEAQNDLKDFTLISVICNSSSDQVNITAMNNGVGEINEGTAILVLTSISGAELYQEIDSGFEGLLEGQARILSFDSDYDLINGETYIARLTLTNGKTRTRSCTANE